MLSRRDERLAAPKSARLLLGLVLTGLAVELALMPIALFHFHKAGLYGALANIVAIPLTTFVIMPLEALALLFDLVGLGAPFWWLAGQALRCCSASPTAPPRRRARWRCSPAMPPAAFALMVAGGLWLCLWRTRWRRWGLVPFAARRALGAARPRRRTCSSPATAAISPCARADGELALLRARAGDYVRDTLAEAAAPEPDLRRARACPAASCSPDLCIADLDARRSALAHPRHPLRHLVDFEPTWSAPAPGPTSSSPTAGLPRACAPRWLKADRRPARRTGGLAITLGERPRVATVAERVGRHPWAGAGR